MRKSLIYVGTEEKLIELGFERNEKNGLFYLFIGGRTASQVSIGKTIDNSYCVSYQYNTDALYCIVRLYELGLIKFVDEFKKPKRVDLEEVLKVVDEKNRKLIEKRFFEEKKGWLKNEL